MNGAYKKKPNSSNAIIHKSAVKHPQTATEQYNVQHVFLKWTIEHFSLFPKRNDKNCVSPIFAVKNTLWNLAIYPKAEINEAEKVVFNLIRNLSDTGPEIVIVSYRMGLESSNGNKVWFKTEEQKNFEKGDRYAFQTSLLGNLKDFVSEGVKNNDDSLSVLCEMYVLHLGYVLNTLEWFNPMDFIDQHFAKDMLSIYCKMENSDVSIGTPKFFLKAHKYILCARSITLSRFLEHDNSFIYLGYNPSCINTAVHYMYSGNFNYIVRNCIFSIGLYELACELSLSKLKLLLIPKEIELKSKTVQDDCKVSGVIKDFKLFDILNNKLDIIRVYVNQAVGIGLNITFHKLQSGNDLNCDVKIAGVVEALHFDFNIYLSNVNHGIGGISRPTSFKDLGFHKLFRHFLFTFSIEDVVSCMCCQDNTLRVNIFCRRISLRNSSPNMIPNANNDEAIPCYEKIWLEDLSSDFKVLFETGQLHDIILLAKTMIFRVHRSMLSARSGYFRQILPPDNPGHMTEMVLNIEPFILHLMCIFMYSGVLRNPEMIHRQLIMQLYRTSKVFKIKSLPEECEKLLFRRIGS